MFYVSKVAKPKLGNLSAGMGKWVALTALSYPRTSVYFAVRWNKPEVVFTSGSSVTY